MVKPAYLESYYINTVGRKMRCVLRVKPDRTSTGSKICYSRICPRREGIIDKEKLWREFFSDPSRWWDNRAEKINPRYPDFKHRKTQQSLFVVDHTNPPWVHAKLATIKPGMMEEDIFTWNKRLARYVKGRQYKKTIELFQQMQREGINPDKYTFVPVLNACSGLRSLEEGRRIHALVAGGKFVSDVYVSNSLIDMYAKCGSIDDAYKVFMKMSRRDMVSWNAMIMGYAKSGEGQKAIELYRQVQFEGLSPNPITFVAVLNACASLLAYEDGRGVHKQILARGWESDVFVASSLVDMYAKCGSIEDAEEVFARMHTFNVVAWSAMIQGYVKCGRIKDALRLFNDMPSRDVVAWSAMIQGYVTCGEGQMALELFCVMEREGVEPNTGTFVAVLNACASVVALEEGRCAHKKIIERGWETDNFLHSCLINMYSKCGSLGDAIRVFTETPSRNAVAWTAMLGGYAVHGYAREAIEHFEGMLQEGIEMDEITFLSLLFACSHGGLVNEGLYIFESMNSVYDISLTVEHYSCVIDLLGRAGRLHEAENLIKTMACEANATVHGSLVGACRIHGNVEMGENVAKQLMELEPINPAGYVALSNIYAAAGKWDSSANIPRERLERGVRKTPGCAWIEVNKEVHSFVVDDRKHPQIMEIWSELVRLYEHMQEAGYVPNNGFTVEEYGEEKEKEVHLSRHSEKLAITFGLISTPADTPLRIFKNHRVCGDCHTAIKFISKVVERAITVGDSNRFHHFEDGVCSCGDYW